MKNDPIRYSSAVGEIWVMATFKVKYCHKIFDIPAARELCNALINESLYLNKIRCKKIAFDSDHVHLIIDMGLHSKIDLAKRIKGYVGRHLLHLMPILKKRKFWGSGLWNPAYDIRNINDMGIYLRYLDRQKYSGTNQRTLNAY